VAIDRIKPIMDRWGQKWGFSWGVPIYVDSEGLREAGQSLDSPVKAPPADRGPRSDPPLGEKLRIILEPLGLAAAVKDGVVVITSRGKAARPRAVADED
jgi:hypothetical protein